VYTFGALVKNIHIAPAYAASSITIMPWVEIRLSKGREGKNEPKFKGGSRNRVTLTAMSMKTSIFCIRERLLF
jgi:hypothetical protein